MCTKHVKQALPDIRDVSKIRAFEYNSNTYFQNDCHRMNM